MKMLEPFNLFVLILIINQLCKIEFRNDTQLWKEMTMEAKWWQ